MKRSHAALFATVVVFGGVGCDSPPALRPDPPIPVLSGTVYEHDAAGQRPVPNYSLYTQPEGLVADPDNVTDSAGRYEVFDRRQGLWFARINTGHYLQPCYASAVPAPGMILDLHVVRESTLAAIGIPESMPIIEPSVTGRVTERSAVGQRSVQGAWVSSGGFTKTDREGRYVLCGVKSGNRIRISGNGYLPLEATIDLDESTTYDFVLTPR